MRCPSCGHEFKSPVAQAGGRSGGAAKVPKGFASAAVMRKALATRARNARSKRSHNKERLREKSAKGYTGWDGAYPSHALTDEMYHDIRRVRYGLTTNGRSER